MKKYTVIKGENGKYKLVKKDFKPNEKRQLADIARDAIEERIKKEKG